MKPVIGENAKIEYLFDTDYLKAGGLSSSGRIDFKDRGIIPQVEKGTVLAEKTPLKESFSGKTIFGKELDTNNAQDIKLRHGQGVKLSEDGLKTIDALQDELNEKINQRAAESFCGIDLFFQKKVLLFRTV